MWSHALLIAALSGNMASAKPAPKAKLPAVNPRAEITSLGEGSYIFVDRPLLIAKGTTILRASPKKSRGRSRALGLADGCDLHLGRATGFNIFQQNLILKAGTKLAWRSTNGKVALVEEDRKIEIPLTCQAVAHSPRAKGPAKFTVGELSRAFASIGIVYVNPAVPSLRAGQKTAKN